MGAETDEVDPPSQHRESSQNSWPLISGHIQSQQPADQFREFNPTRGLEVWIHWAKTRRLRSAKLSLHEENDLEGIIANSIALISETWSDPRGLSIVEFVIGFVGPSRGEGKEGKEGQQSNFLYFQPR